MSATGHGWRGQLGRAGILSYHVRFLDRDSLADVAQKIERLGFRALWLPGGQRDGLFDDVRTVLEATAELNVVTAIVPIFKVRPGVVAESYAAIEHDLPGRLVVGIGLGHREDVDPAEQREFDRPMAPLRRYLAALDDLGGPPLRRRVLGAQGPRMLEFAAQTTTGAHPYNVTPDHTATARSILGSGALLAPEQAVVLEPDPHVALDTARRSLAAYFARSNYVKSWRRQGFTDDDLRGGGCDRLVRALVATGGPESAVARVDAHLDAGADHVCLNLISDAIAELRPDWPNLDISSLVDGWTQLSEDLRLRP